MKKVADSELTHINIIEGLISAIHGHLEAISPRTTEQAEVKDEARNKLANWERNELFELRRIFEE